MGGPKTKSFPDVKKKAKTDVLKKTEGKTISQWGVSKGIGPKSRTGVTGKGLSKGGKLVVDKSRRGEVQACRKL